MGDDAALPILVTAADAGARLDRFVAETTGLSRTLAQQLIEEGQVTLNGRQPAKSALLKEGDSVEVTVPPPREIELVAQPMDLDIVYEDAHLLVVNKPKGLVVHPAPGHEDGTLVNGLMHHCRDSLSGIGGELRPGIVHRIDKDTSGLLVVAKDDETHRGLSEQFAVHSIERVYHAVVYGAFREESGEVDAPIGRSANDRKRMAVNQKNAKTAKTTYRVAERFEGFTHLSLALCTGRTHQIRVHMASIGHPVAGDPVYGPKKVIKSLEGQCLHAATLGFVHPVSGEALHFESPLPPYFTQFLARLRTV